MDYMEDIHNDFDHSNDYELPDATIDNATPPEQSDSDVSDTELSDSECEEDLHEYTPYCK